MVLAMDIPDSTHQQKDSLTQNKCKNFNTAPEYNWKPKITVKCKHFLYNLSYSEIPNTNDSNTELSSLLKIKKIFNILLYIDIPTIDYYLDELNDSKLSKLNKKFKLNILKQSIWRSFTNNDPHFWYKLIQAHNNTSSSVINCNLSIKSSGSLRYVETIKFLIETIYDTLSPHKDTITLKINLNVSRISLKWFKIFLKSSVLKLIRFIECPNSLTIPDSPFKEYFNKLNEKFILDEKQLLLSDTVETIIIITNSMGIKALLTILADKPLTHFIDKRSIDQLYNNKTCPSHRPITDSSSRQQTSLGNSTTNEYRNGTFVGGVLDRESSSLLNFQKSSLTSNKDRSVRIRSLSINRRSNKLLEPRVNEVPFKTQIISSHKEPLRSISRTKDILQLIDQEDIHQSEKESNNEIWLENNKKVVKSKPLCSDKSFISHIEDVFISDEEFSEGVVGTSEEDDDNEQEEEEDYTYDDEGISFYVPSLLSRSGSLSDVNSSSPISYPKKGRFRSLSLMDPAQRQPFNYDQSFNDSTTNNNNNSNANNTTENDMSKHKTNSFTNIYIHDGNFNNKYRSKQYKRKYNNNFNSNIISIQSNNGALPINPNLNGLIPPEFYSRLPTPSISEKNSTMTLNNSYLSPHYNTNENTAMPQINTFDTNLINKSLELNKDDDKPIHNIFNKLINKKNEERNRHFTLINSSERQYVDNYNNNNNSNNNSNSSELCCSNLLRELEEEDQMLGTVLEDNIVTDISQKPPSSVPYKVHESITTSSSNLNLFNHYSMNKESLNPLCEQSSLTQLNFSLYNEDNNLSENKTNLQENYDANDVVDSKESNATTFKIIASLNLYGSDDEQNDDYSSNMWVLGGNR